MKIPAIAIVCWFGLATVVAAQGANQKSASAGPSSKPTPAEVRKILHELQGQTEKLHELMEQYRSHMAEKPHAPGEQLNKWNAWLERLLHRIEEAHAAVSESEHRLDPSNTGPLPTNLAKEVVAAHNEAEPERTAAEHALKNKPAPSKTSKTTKQAPTPAKPPPDIPDDL